jgi:hypothetical protein
VNIKYGVICVKCGSVNAGGVSTISPTKVKLLHMDVTHEPFERSVILA